MEIILPSWYFDLVYIAPSPSVCLTVNQVVKVYLRLSFLKMAQTSQFSSQRDGWFSHNYISHNDKETVFHSSCCVSLCLLSFFYTLWIKKNKYLFFYLKYLDNNHVATKTHHFTVRGLKSSIAGLHPMCSFFDIEVFSFTRQVERENIPNYSQSLWE